MQDVNNAVKYRTLKQMVAHSGVSDATLRRWVKEGRINAFQPGGPNSKLLFLPDALEQPVADSQPVPAIRSEPVAPPRSGPRWQQRHSNNR